MLPNQIAQWEFKRETNVDASLEESRILGVHQNLLSGAIDILAVFRVGVTHDHLAEKIKLESQLAQEKHDDPGHTAEYWKARKLRLIHDFSFSDKKELDSSPGVPEHQVHGTQNWFVQFDYETLLSFFATINANGQTILPEAHQVILRALNATSF